MALALGSVLAGGGGTAGDFGLTRVSGGKTLNFCPVGVVPGAGVGVGVLLPQTRGPEWAGEGGRKPVAFVDVSSARSRNGTRVTPAPPPRGRPGKRGRGQQGLLQPPALPAS